MCTQYHHDKAVCPTQLRFGIPTFCTIDNIDINPKSNTAKGSFHGTILSLLQTPRESRQGTVRPFATIREENVHDKLPDNYAIVPAELEKIVSEYPVNKNYTIASTGILEIVKQPHNEWVDTVEKCLFAEVSDDCVTWRSFFKN